jgi:hypothetical protein
MAAKPTPNPPIPFAVLRNGHEGLRAGIKELSECVTNPTAFDAAWQNFKRALAIHASMEDNDVFRFLDSIGDGQITREKIPDEHSMDTENIKAVDAALSAKPVNAAHLEEAFQKWRTYHLAHLEHEEKTMGPITPKTGATPDARAKAFHEKIMTPAYKRDPNGLDFFIGYIVQQLSTRGSTANPPEVAVRVFVHGLKAASNAEQWHRYLPTIKAQCSPKIYEQMRIEYHIEDPQELQH